MKYSHNIGIKTFESKYWNISQLIIINNKLIILECFENYHIYFRNMYYKLNKFLIYF